MEKITKKTIVSALFEDFFRAYIIKFRAWDERKKKMRMVSCIYWNTLEWYISRVELDGKDTESGITLMQSTGLKDKNDKEIYEGDVVLRDGKPMEVVKRGACFDLLERSKKLKREVYWGICWSYEDMQTTPYEVIGNRWENPELVEGKE